MKSPSKFILACGLAGMFLAVGFQASNLKFATVDMGRVYADSENAARQNEILKNFQASRNGVLDFVQTYAMMKPEEAQRFRDVSIKDPQSDADKNLLQGLKDNAVKSEIRMRELQTKQNLTDPERTELTGYNNNRQANLGLLQRWAQEFDNDIRQRLETVRIEALAKVRQAVGNVGRDGAYTIIFSNEMVPFAGTDVTAEALKAMNKIR